MKTEPYKQELTSAFIRSTDGLPIDLTIAFLAGHLCGSLRILPDRTNRTAVSSFCSQLFENAKSDLITQTNVIEIVVEASMQCSKYAGSSEIKSKLQSKIHENVNEVAMNRKHLRQKWLQEQSSQMDEERPNPGSKVWSSNISSDSKSLQLIKQLEEEERREAEARKKKAEEEEEALRKFLQEEEERERRDKEMKDNQAIECQICLEEIPYSDMGTLECGHIFHRQCIREHIAALVNEKKVDIDCPAGCGGKLTVADVHEFIDGDLREKYEKFSFDVYVEKNQADSSWCPTPGCTAAFSWEEELDNYRCPACKMHYCLKCKCNYHYGVTCAQYRISNSYGEDDKKFEEFVKGANYKQCPKCKFWVERIEGCSTMTCRCGHEFCYDCGGSDCPHGACKNLHLIRPGRPVPVVQPFRPRRQLGPGVMPFRPIRPPHRRDEREMPRKR